MPVQETADGIAELHDAQLPGGGVIVNLVRPRDLNADQLKAVREGTVDRRGLADDLTEVGLEVDDALIDGLLEEGRHHAERRQLEDRQRNLIEAMGVPTTDLPRLPSGVDMVRLYALAGMLRAQGLTRSEENTSVLKSSMRI